MGKIAIKLAFMINIVATCVFSILWMKSMRI